MNFEQFQKDILVTFHNEDLLKQAFVHRSYLNEHREISIHNERLEFLGDAVLELVTTEYLFLHFALNEGELTNLRSSLVKRETLAEVARDLNIGPFLFLSKGERASGGADKDYILANTIEAIIGALYLDQGYEKVKEFVRRFIISKLDSIVEQKKHIDSKSLFQEKSQEILGITPEYRVVFTEGPDHNKMFTMGVYLNEEFISQGKGSSKQLAEQNAAREALLYKGWDVAL